MVADRAFEDPSSVLYQRKSRTDIVWLVIKTHMSVNKTKRKKKEFTEK